MNFRSFLTALASLLISACATTPTPEKEAVPIPNERVLAFQTKPSEDAATILLTRDSGHLGSGCHYGFWINGILSARLDPAEIGTFHVAPGEYLLRVGRDPQGRGLCSLEKDEWTQRETILKPREVKRFRLSIDMNGKTDIQRSDQ
jgi:hypothetical protein